MNNGDIKRRIYKRRIEKGLSQAEVAEMLSISQTSYYKIEKGNTNLISERLPQIAAALGIKEDELIFGYLHDDGADLNAIISLKDKRIAELEKIIEDTNKIIELLYEKLDKK